MIVIDVKGIAESLLKAYATGDPVDPPTKTYPDLTVGHAYAIQLAQVDRWTTTGQRLVGHKVGLTSAVMQQQLGVDQPDYGHLTANMLYSESQPIPLDRFISPKIEPEIAFVLESALTGPGVTVADAVSAVDYVLPALEIIDSRVRDWKISLADTIADNASSGGVVLGSTPSTLAHLSQAGFSLQTIGCVLTHNGRVIGTGAGAAVLGSPINALVWLANTVGPLGITLDAGSIIMPGSVTAAAAVAPSDCCFTATFAGLGSVTAVFSDSTKD
jgi:2-keto-4-pentenoate hydratase